MTFTPDRKPTPSPEISARKAKQIRTDYLSASFMELRDYLHGLMAARQPHSKAAG